MERYFKCVLLLVFIVTAHMCLCVNSNAPCIEQERQSLLHFKASISQNSSNKLSSWKGTHCCRWEGIGCDNVTGHVVKLDLRNPFYPPFWRPRGVYPHFRYHLDVDNDMPYLPLIAPNVSSSLLQLEHLTYLDFTGNDFCGSSIPMFIGSMQHLQYLSLSHAHFCGTIPNNLGNLKNLQFLDLSVNYNYFGPSFEMNSLEINSDTTWISKLHSLKHLDLSHALIKDTHNLFQVLNLLPSLLHLSLYSCKLDTSLIPRYAFQNMTSLVYLDLSWNMLHGPILESFRNMTSIESLYLSENNFNSIPSWFSDLEKLTLLGLSGNALHGQIPSYAFTNFSALVHLDLSFNQLDSVSSLSFGNLKKLAYLDLSFNVFNGPIPEVFQNMTSIESLYLSENDFTLIPSWFCNFEKLTFLDLSLNDIHGPIPEAFQNLTSIEFLDLSENNLTSIPSWFVELKTLVYLDLSSNQLKVTEYFLSSIINTMCSLKYLFLSRNKLYTESMKHFEISKCIRYDLQYLGLGYNYISGHLPTWLEKLENLKHLDFTSNFLHGPIPLSIGKLSKLQELFLSNNTFEGLIPENIGQLVNLTYLDLSSNKFDGSIPKSLWKLANLDYLHLSKNSFNGLVHENIGQLVNLTDLDLSFNKFDGSIPQNLWKLANLEFLDLSNNCFKGVIPESHLNLQYLDLSHNQISGSLPKSIGHIMLSSDYLFLENNNFNGSIPFSLCQSQLNTLDLSNNKLTGEIPNCWEKSQELTAINLSSNKLTGAFPRSFGNLSSLLWLHLNNNGLQGEFPTSFRNLKQLLILDLGENQLSGSIPSSWTVNTFTSLQVLRLRQNMLSGYIPSQLCQLKSLKILDLSRNKLQGSIPRCIGHLEGMILEQPISIPSSKFIAEAPHIWSNELLANRDSAPGPSGYRWSDQGAKEGMKGVDLDYTKILKLVVNMDLSQNKLVGFIPDEITWLTGLHGLNLAKNQLKGEISHLIGNMKSLESLDISHNQLSGQIPNTMSAITSLSYLNLSHNNFSGPIPKDNQFSTFNDPSIYAYNPYLCGSPLPNMCPGDVLPGASESKGNEDEDGIEKVWFYFVIALGFGTGFWGVIGTLWFKKNWRHAYFSWVEDIVDDIYLAVVIKVEKIKKMKRNQDHE